MHVCMYVPQAMSHIHTHTHTHTTDSQTHRLTDSHTHTLTHWHTHTLGAGAESNRQVWELEVMYRISYIMR
jgi:hypothetical protein